MLSTLLAVLLLAAPSEDPWKVQKDDKVLWAAPTAARRAGDPRGYLECHRGEDPVFKVVFANGLPYDMVAVRIGSVRAIALGDVQVPWIEPGYLNRTAIITLGAPQRALLKDARIVEVTGFGVWRLSTVEMDLLKKILKDPLCEGLAR